MPGDDLSIYLREMKPDDFAKWLTKRFGGDLTANRYAADDIWAVAGDADALQDKFGGEALDDLMDFIQERHGMKSDRGGPPVSKGYRPGWLTRKPQ